MIRLGVQTWGIDVAALDRYWRAADGLGYARVTYGDGLWGFTHDGWTMLAVLASVTRHARVGPAVTYGFDPSSHHPSWLAKRAVTVDHLSAGRLDLRLGLGADDRATAAVWRSHGIAYPPLPERIARLEETVEIVTGLWRGTLLRHRGTTYVLDHPELSPRPVQRPGPPIWIAAMRPAGLALAARHADGWEASYVTPRKVEALWAGLARRLAAAGRAPDTFGRSVELDVALVESRAAAGAALAGFCAARGIAADHPVAATVLAGDAVTVAERIAAYAAAGATDLMLGFTDFPSTRMLERFATQVTARLPAAVVR